MTMKILSVRMAATLLLFAFLAVGTNAQSTTDTNCTQNGQQINCTSNTTTPPDNSAAQAQQQQQANETGKAVGSAIGGVIAAHKAEKAAEERVTVNVVYCNQNPDGFVFTKDDPKQPCNVEIAKVRAVCTVKPKYSFCKMLLPVTEAKK
jgi:hypothetical protein